MAIATLNPKKEVKKPEGFDEKIISKTIQKLYKHKHQCDNSKCTCRGK